MVLLRFLFFEFLQHQINIMATAKYCKTDTIICCEPFYWKQQFNFDLLDYFNLWELGDNRGGNFARTPFQTLHFSSSYFCRESQPRL